MAEFQKEYPLVRYRVFSSDSDNIKEQIERGLLDMGLLMEPVDISKYDFVRIPEEEVWGVLVREDMELAKKEICGSRRSDGLTAYYDAAGDDAERAHALVRGICGTA